MKFAAEISRDATIGENCIIWAGTNIREFARVGDATTIGQFCYVGPGVVIGANCKIQNHVLLYEPAIIADSVFIGPRVTITNDVNPRAINLDGSVKRSEDWMAQAAEVHFGASLGAGAILVGPIKIGSWALVAAGSVVTKDVMPYALVAGVPAVQIGWVGKAGFKLLEIAEGLFLCPESNEIYKSSENGLVQVDKG